MSILQENKKGSLDFVFVDETTHSLSPIFRLALVALIFMCRGMIEEMINACGLWMVRLSWPSLDERLLELQLSSFVGPLAPTLHHLHLSHLGLSTFLWLRSLLVDAQEWCEKLMPSCSPVLLGQKLVFFFTSLWLFSGLLRLLLLSLDLLNF